MPAMPLFRPVLEGSDPAAVLRGVARSLNHMLPAMPGEPLPPAWNEVLTRLRAVDPAGPDRRSRA